MDPKNKEAAKLTPEQVKEAAKVAAKKAKRDLAKKEMKEAKSLLFNFISAKAFNNLTEDIQNAIKRIASKPSRSTGTRVTLLDQFGKMFPKVGATINELDIFKATKMGRGEFKKKVRYALKKADADKRMWISFDESTESWTLHGIGADVPKGFETGGVAKS